jgi:hypothetical protein
MGASRRKKREVLLNDERRGGKNVVFEFATKCHKLFE